MGPHEYHEYYGLHYLVRCNEDDAEVCHTPGIINPHPLKKKRLLQCRAMHINDMYEYYLVETQCYKAEGSGFDSR